MAACPSYLQDLPEIARRLTHRSRHSSSRPDTGIELARKYGAIIRACDPKGAPEVAPVGRVAVYAPSTPPPHPPIAERGLRYPEFHLFTPNTAAPANPGGPSD